MNKKKFWLSLCLLICLIMAAPTAASAAKGWVTTNGETYYYGSNNKMYTGGPKKISGKLYMFTSKGVLIKNQVTLYRKKLYVSTSNGSLLTKWGTFNKKKYYGTSSGYLKTGLQKYKNNYYYFNTSNGSMLKNSWKKVGKYNYYFTGTGKAVKNKIYTIGDQKYYFDSNGRRVSGVTKVGKYYYGFGTTSGRMMHKWVKFGKFTYYFGSTTGRATTGWKTFSNKQRHYFDKQGRLQTGWYISGSKKYYLDPSKKGAQVFGKKTIGGKTYNFGTKGYLTYSASSTSIRVEVNRQKNVVTVYENNIPIKAMTCSTGRNNLTPTGTFMLQSHRSWWILDGPSWGQYCSHFLPSYLFHSVPIYSSQRNPYGVESWTYNKLGQQASAGCVRLTVADAKWIYYNVPIGSTVIVSDKAATPLGKPSIPKMASGTIGADPTDDFSNPGGYDVKIK